MKIDSATNMHAYYRLLAVGLIVATTNNFVWFALTYWIYLETKSVVSTSTLGGLWLVLMASSSIWLGSIVDHYKKKLAMLISSTTSVLLYILGFFVFTMSSDGAFASVASPQLWVFVSILMIGVIAGSMYHIAIPTLVALLVPEDRRDRANGLFGTVMGVSFAITSVASGLVLAFGGLRNVLLVAIVCTIIAILVLAFIKIPEHNVIHTAEAKPKKIDLKGTIAAVRNVPGLFSLIFYTTFNNLIGGVFMALMDAYGLTLVSVQQWGLLWGFLSFSFIFGGLYVSKRGLGVNPLRTLFRINIVAWTVCIFFTVQPSIVLLAVGVFIWMFFIPFVEATEQTIFQKVVPPDRLGRVFGFAHSVEQAASPVTAFVIGPIAQLIFIPFMTTGAGVELIGEWFGTGVGRGIALVFILAGLTGLIATLIAMRSKPYARLAAQYMKSA